MSTLPWYLADADKRGSPISVCPLRQKRRARYYDASRSRSPSPPTPARPQHMA